MSQLPTLAELYSEDVEAIKHDQLNYILSQPIPKSWIKKHPIIKVKDGSGASVALEYLPIDKIKYLLRRIFKRNRIEIIDKGVIFQSVFVHCRVHYCDPVTGDWDFHDGIGAVGVQTDAGKSAADLAAIKSDAIMKALPAAMSYAVKNACENFGLIFGEGLNKWDAVTFEAFKPMSSIAAPAPVSNPSPEPIQF